MLDKLGLQTHTQKM